MRDVYDILTARQEETGQSQLPPCHVVPVSHRFLEEVRAQEDTLRGLYPWLAGKLLRSIRNKRDSDWKN